MSLFSAKRASTRAALSLNTDKSFPEQTPLPGYSGSYLVKGIDYPDPLPEQKGSALETFRKDISRWVKGSNIEVDTGRVLLHHGLDRIEYGNLTPNVTIIKSEEPHAKGPGSDILLCQPECNSGDWCAYNGADFSLPYEVVRAARQDISRETREQLLRDHSEWILDRKEYELNPGKVRTETSRNIVDMRIGGEEAKVRADDWFAVLNIREKDLEESRVLTIMRNPVFTSSKGSLTMEGDLEMYLDTGKTFGPESFGAVP